MMLIGLPIIVISYKPLKWAIENNLKGLFSEVYFALNINEKTRKILEGEVKSEQVYPVILVGSSEQVLWKRVKGVEVCKITSIMKFQEKVNETNEKIKKMNKWTGGYFNYLQEQLKYLFTHS